ncbi:MAG TPA: serine/threonine-protein kinase [Polyangiaceae bacterium]
MDERETAPTATIEGPPPVLQSDVPPGSQIGRYVVLRQLGFGGMGAVYAAYDTELDRRVALKFLRHRTIQANAEAWRARMMREAKAMARLSHPNVVTIYDVGVADDGRIFLAIEVVDGGTLQEWLDAAPRTWREIVRVLCEAGEGLAAAHAVGMIHRDFKLANVLFGKDGRPRVTDFGLARTTEEASSEEEPIRAFAASGGDGSGPKFVPPSANSSGSLPRLTLTGSLMGTPGYMAPEQYTSVTEIDARTDVFGFSATLYRALYGEPPFRGGSVEEIADATLEGTVRDPPKGSAVPAWVRKILLWGLAPKRDDRPASMAELLGALRADPRRRRQRWLATGAVVAAVLAAGLSVRAVQERRARECRAMAERVGDVWNEPRKEAIAAAFRASGVGYAEDTWRRVEKRLDAYASAWSQATQGACAATRMRGEQSEPMLDLRASCLDERLDDLRALSDVLATADAKTVQRAVQAASALESIEPCANVDRLSAAGRLPSDPAARARIRGIQADVASARELLATGKETPARARLEALRDPVEAANYGPARLAWTMVSARDAQWRDMTDAVGWWQRVIALAETNHLDREKAEAEIRLGRVFNELGRHEDAHVWFGLGSATLARLGGDPSLSLLRDVYEGWAYRDEAKYADAVRVLEPAIARAVAAHVGVPVPLADAQSFLGMSLVFEPARFDDAIDHARAAVVLVEDALGAQHVDVAAMLSNLAVVEMEAGRLEEALATASRCVETFEGAVQRGEVSELAPNFGNALLNRGEALLRMRRAAEAIASVMRARGIYEAHGKEDSILEADLVLARAWTEQGHLVEAAHFGAEARTLADKDKETTPDLLVELLIAEARLALAQGKGESALPRAEKALALAATGVSYPYDQANARLVLAQALVKAGGEPARASRLAKEAQAGFAALRDRARGEEAEGVLERGR